jgi:hypothetical protein
MSDELIFQGQIPLVSGQRICALIPRYESHREEGNFGCESRRKLYTDRPYKPEEEAIEIEILNDKESLRTDRSSSYERFKRPEKS